MFKSIFSKYFAVVSLVVCIGFLAMAATQGVVSANSWMNQKQQLLTENARRIADSVAQNSRLSPNSETEYVLNLDAGSTVPVVTELLSAAIHADVFITDNRGVICTSSSQGGALELADTREIPESVIAEMEKTTDYFTVGTMNGLYPDRHYMAGTPVVKNGVQIGYVFAASSAADLTTYLLQNLQTYLISFLVVLMLSFILIYLSAYRLVRPLRQMAAATRSFGEGDFSYRIPVKGQDEMAELAASLNTMAASLSEVDAMSRTFVANVSHELRTPMTTISGFVDGILDGTIPKDKAPYYLDIVSQEIKRLSRLVQSMLNLSRIDNGSIQIRPTSFDLTALAAHTLLSFEPRIEEKHLRIVGLEDGAPCPVTADADLLGQVVYNLLDNAVKFTDDGGVITLRISRQRDRAVVTVRNTGEGIPAEEMPHIFDRFYKSDRSRSRDKVGVGLGLFLVKS
ncbi:MAG: HAMP domain-containing histidine kinase, partial [Clostridia bacterium]|nr:HAMP domain-containing histidine kinase [Clostridia bacterium]